MPSGAYGYDVSGVQLDHTSEIPKSLALIAGAVQGQGGGGSGGIPVTPQSTTPNPQNLTAGASVTAPIGASEFSVLLKTGTGTITVGAQSAFNLTIGVPVEFQAPLKTAIVVTLGSPGTADVTWSV